MILGDIMSTKITIRQVRSLFVIVFVLLMALPIMGTTETVNGITWTYTVSNDEASLGGGSEYYTAVPTSTKGALTIPSRLGGYPVTSIGHKAFYGCSGLTNITIPNSVTNIREYAFSGCRL